MNLSALVLVVVVSWFESRLTTKLKNGEDKLFAGFTAMQLRSFAEGLLVITVAIQFVSLAIHVDSDKWPWQEFIMFLITFSCVIVFMLTPYIWDTHRKVIRTMYPQWSIQNKDALFTIILTLLETFDLKDSGSGTWFCGIFFTICLMLMQWASSFLLIDMYDELGEKAPEKFWKDKQLQLGWEKPLLKLVGLWLVVVAFFGSVPCLCIALSLGYDNFSPITLLFLTLKVITFGRACWLSYCYFQRGDQWEEECRASQVPSYDFEPGAKQEPMEVEECPICHQLHEGNMAQHVNECLDRQEYLSERQIYVRQEQ